MSTPSLFLYFFSFSVSPPSLFFLPFSNHCEIARRLVGDFSDREIWLRSESLPSIPAFLSQFKWFRSRTDTPTQTARHTHIDNLQVSRPLFLCHSHMNIQIQTAINTHKLCHCSCTSKQAASVTLVRSEYRWETMEERPQLQEETEMSWEIDRQRSWAKCIIKTKIQCLSWCISVLQNPLLCTV